MQNSRSNLVDARWQDIRRANTLSRAVDGDGRCALVTRPPGDTPAMRIADLNQSHPTGEKRLH